MFFVMALLIGVIAGLRAMTPVAAVAWAANLGWLKLSGTLLVFLAQPWALWVFTIAAVAELVSDQLPMTPSRKVPVQFGARLFSGALCGAVLGIAAGNLIVGAVLGVVGAVVGTFGGAEARRRLAGLFGRDLPAALIEDVAAVGGAFLIVWAFA
jgi:uncharacterized membrane protein